jgi:hypothetical protein
MAISIADYLMDFDLGGGGEKSPPPRPSSVGAPREEARSDQEELIRIAEMRAREEERRAAERTLEVALASERAAAEDRLRMERERWIRDEAERLSSGLSSGLKEIEEKISDKVAKILIPFLGATLHEQALNELASTLDALLARRSAASVTIAASDDLISELKPRLGVQGDMVKYLPNQSTDFRIVVDETIIETRLSAWLDRLAEPSKVD